MKIDKKLLSDLNTNDLLAAYNNPKEYLIGIIEKTLDSTAYPLLGYRWTPLIMALLQSISVTLMEGIVLLAPEMPAAALVGFIALALVNRFAAVYGFASTCYQYKNGLYGTQMTDVLVSGTTLVTGFFSSMTGSSATLNSVYTAYRSFGGQLPPFLP
jgi:hypothetical protein